MRTLLSLLLLAATALSPAAPANDEAARIKDRYIRYLVGTDTTFCGRFGAQAHETFLKRLKRPIQRAMSFDTTRDAGKPFRAFPGTPEHGNEQAVYSPMLQQYLPALAFGYCVEGLDNPHYRNPEVLACYLRCLRYLHGRGDETGLCAPVGSGRRRPGLSLYRRARETLPGVPHTRHA